MNRAAIIFILAICAFFASCEKETILIAEPSTISFTDAGGTQSITLTANKAWSARADQSWCQVSPSAGEDDAGTRIIITCDANTSYDARSCTITITCAEMTKTISVSQATNNGLLVSQTEYNLSNSAQKLNIEVKANVTFDVLVDDTCKGWIKHTATKGLSNSTVELDIAANDTYDGREGKVTIRQKDGSLQTNITIKQGQTNGLFITTSEYNLSNEKHTLTVEVLSNIEFDVKPEVSWIRFVETKGLKTSQIVLDIEANEDYDAREGKVTVKQKNGDLSGTITIKQEQNYGLFVSEPVLNISNEAQTIDVELKYNVEYAVVIPEADKSWITEVNTKGLTSRHHSFHSNKNETLDNRTASITFKQKDGPLSGTVRINQAQTDSISIDKSEFDLTYENQTVDVEVKSNVDYQVDIPSSCSSWIRLIGTKGVTTEMISFDVSENTTGDERTGNILIKQTNGLIRKAIKVIQWQKGVLIVEGANDTIINSAANLLDISVKTNQEFTIDIDGGDWLQVVETKALSEYKRSISIKDNASIDYREARVNIKTIDGEYSKSFKITQRADDNKTVLYTFNIQDTNIPIRLFNAYDFSEEMRQSMDRLFIDDELVDPALEFVFSTTGEHEVRVIFKNNAVPQQFSAGNSYLKRVIIGDEINFIGRSCFNGCHNIEYIYIGRDVSHIGQCLVSFGSPNLLIEVSPDNNTYDNRNNCNCVIETKTGTLIAGSGRSVIPQGVTKIVNAAFWQTRGLQSITIPSSVKLVEYGAFMNTDMTTLTIESKDTQFEEGSFYWNEKLERIEADQQLVSDDHRCFVREGILLIFAYKGLTNYTLPSGITRIGREVFARTFELKNVVLPKGLKTIAPLAFRDAGITQIEFPENMETIEIQSFWRCSKLTFCIIGKGLKKIQAHAFQECEELSELYSYSDIAPKLDTWGSPFEGIANNGTLYIPEGSDYSEWMQNKEDYLGYKNWKVQTITTEVQDIVLNPAQLQLDVGQYTQILVTLTPRSAVAPIAWKSTNVGIATISSDGIVTAISPGECEIIASAGGITATCKLRVISFDPNNPDVSLMFIAESSTQSVNILYNYVTDQQNDAVEKIYVDGEEIEITNYHKFKSAGYHKVDYFFKNHRIPRLAFTNCQTVGTAMVSDNVLSIGENAFLWNYKLEAIKIGKNVNDIHGRICEGCESLTEISIDPDNLTYDSRNNCNAVVETAKNKILQACPVTVIPNSITTIGESSFSAMKGMKRVVIPASVSIIESNAFDGADIEEMEINCTKIETVGMMAFRCSSLELFSGSYTGIVAKGKGLCVEKKLVAIAPKGITSFEVPYGVTCIGQYAFSSDNTIKEIKLPESLTDLEPFAFQCSTLEEITLPNSLKYISDCCFTSNPNLKKCIIGSGVENIGNQAFQWCSNLSEIRCTAKTAPTLKSPHNVFGDVAQKGVLYIPAGSDYSEWMKNNYGCLGYRGWSVVEIY